MVKIKKSNKKNKIALIATAVILLGLVASGLVYANRDTKNASTTAPESVGQEEQTVNLEPPTEEDAQRVDENKQRIIENESKTGQPSQPAGSSKKSVTPVITYAGQYGQDVEVGAYVNVLEEGGTCTATFTNGTSIVTKSVQAVRNANSADCPVMGTTVSELRQKGTWTVTVRYDSTSSTGTSAQKQIEVM